VQRLNAATNTAGGGAAGRRELELAIDLSSRVLNSLSLSQQLTGRSEQAVDLVAGAAMIQLTEGGLAQIREKISQLEQQQSVSSARSSTDMNLTNMVGGAGEVFSGLRDTITRISTSGSALLQQSSPAKRSNLSELPAEVADIAVALARPDTQRVSPAQLEQFVAESSTAVNDLIQQTEQKQQLIQREIESFASGSALMTLEQAVSAAQQLQQQVQVQAGVALRAQANAGAGVVLSLL